MAFPFDFIKTSKLDWRITISASCKRLAGIVETGYCENAILAMLTKSKENNIDFRFMWFFNEVKSANDFCTYYKAYYFGSISLKKRDSNW